MSSGSISPLLVDGTGGLTAPVLVEGQYGTGYLAGIAIGMDVVNNTNAIAAINSALETNATAVAATDLVVAANATDISTNTSAIAATDLVVTGNTDEI